MLHCETLPQQKKRQKEKENKKRCTIEKGEKSGLTDRAAEDCVAFRSRWPLTGLVGRVSAVELCSSPPCCVGELDCEVLMRHLHFYPLPSSTFPGHQIIIWRLWAQLDIVLTFSFSLKALIISRGLWVDLSVE